MKWEIWQTFWTPSSSLLLTSVQSGTKIYWFYLPDRTILRYTSPLYPGITDDMNCNIYFLSGPPAPFLPTKCQLITSFQNANLVLPFLCLKSYTGPSVPVGKVQTHYHGNLILPCSAPACFSSLTSYHPSSHILSSGHHFPLTFL